jgi:uncharacterized Zn finger protein
MGPLADHKEGLFPRPHEITSSCSCPDWATICKHAPAVLYGMAHRLDQKPALLSVLRGVKAAELAQEKISLEQVSSTTGFTNIDTGTMTTEPDLTSSIKTLTRPRLPKLGIKKGWTIA